MRRGRVSRRIEREPPSSEPGIWLRRCECIRRKAWGWSDPVVYDPCPPPTLDDIEVRG